MVIEQIYTNCLAQGAYFIESNGEVAIIDPLREIDSYISKADKFMLVTDMLTQVFDQLCRHVE